MTADVPTGLVVLHVRLTVQVLAPAAMLHDGDAGVSVPEMVAAVAWVRTKKKKRTEHHPDTKPMLRTSQLRRNTGLRRLVIPLILIRALISEIVSAGKIGSCSRGMS
jgi:hypothetical protein